MSPLLSLIAMPSHQRKSLISWQTFVLLLVSIGCSTYPSLLGRGSKSNNIYCNAQLLNAYDQAYGLWNIKLNKHLFARRRWHVDTTLSSVLNDNDNGDGGISERRSKKRGKRKKIASGDLQLMFPNIIQSIEQNDNNNEDDTKRDYKDETTQSHSSTGEQQQLQTTTTVSKPVNSIQCILNLERSGKFTLSLVDENDRHKQHQHEKKLSLDDNVYEESQSSSTASSDMVSSNNKHQPLQGEWYLTPNPYCVTDRQYDTLLLVSEPRMRRIRSSQRSSKRILPTLSRLLLSSSIAESSSSFVIERATVELRCKLYGRYSMGSIRNILGMKHGRCCGRMVCGSIVIVKEVISTDGSSSDNERRRVRKKEKTREVIGTFSGRTIVNADDDMSSSQGDRLFEKEIEDDEDESDFEHF